MAREIKVVQQPDGQLNVRNIPDALSRGETVVAARWQTFNNAIYTFAADDDANEVLRQQADAPVDETAVGTFSTSIMVKVLHRHIAEQWDDETAHKAVKGSA